LQLYPYHPPEIAKGARYDAKGVPWGSVLGHLLFNIYLSDLSTMGVSRNFSSEGQNRHFAYLFQFVGEASAMQMDVHKKMFSVMATVTYNVFPIRKFYTEKMFVLVRLDILRQS